jgi:hypothetical protein
MALTQVAGGMIASGATLTTPNITTGLTLTGAAGTSGQFLTSGGSGAAPTWTTAASSQWTTSGSNIYYSTGNVGINTSTPARRFEVNGAGAVAARISGTNPVLEFGVNSGTNTYFMLAAQANVGDCFEITPSTTNGGFTFSNPALTVRSNGTVTINGTTTGVSGISTGMCITKGSKEDCLALYQDSAGGYTGSAQTTSNGGTYYFWRWLAGAGNQIGQITGTSTNTTYGTSSDYRLKENVQPMTGALAKVARLKPVTYKWKLNGEDGDGFLAHELQEVCPHAVTGDKNAVETYKDKQGNDQTRPKWQTVDTSFLVATLTAAIQELKTIVDAQAVEIAALKAR